MNWKKFTDEEPQKGNLILVISRQLGFEGKELLINDLSLPIVTRMYKGLIEGDEIHQGDIKVVSTPEYWCEVPDFSDLK